MVLSDGRGFQFTEDACGLGGNDFADAMLARRFEDAQCADDVDFGVVNGMVDSIVCCRPRRPDG
jgi:hypothetical protein